MGGGKSLQLGVFGLGLLEDGDAGVGVFPKGEEILGNEGLTPVTLYGLLGIQAEVSSHKLDGRIRVTSGSPSNPLSISHAPQYAQWVLGGGYTIRQGLRVGISGFRGPYLSPDVAPVLPAGTSVRMFPASGLGLEVQWARGHWSASGE